MGLKYEPSSEPQAIRSSSSDPPFTHISLDVVNDPMYTLIPKGLGFSV